MPENPFGGIGSRGGQRATQAQARAVRAYSAQLKRLLAMEEALGGASDARALAASRAIQDHNKAIGRTSSLLEGQGKALKNLDRVRQRYHDAEIERTKSLAYHYEKAKQFLTELREDTDDTSTVLGTFTRGWKSGIDNMLRYGKLPEASQQIREMKFDWEDLGGSVTSIAGHFRDLGSGMIDQAGGVNQLRQNMVELDDAMVALDARYALAEGSGRKLGSQIVQMAAIDIGGGDGAVAQVTRLADQLTVLNTIAGVTAEQGLQFAIERSQQVGGSMSDAMGDIERFSAMADLMREHLEEDNISMTRFSFAIREDFVKAMMEARRMLKGQTVDLENVGAAFQWAARKAIEYGASAQGATQFAKAFGKLAFGGEELTPESMMAGQRLMAQQEAAMRKMEKKFGVDFADMGEAQKRATEEAVAAQMGLRGEGEGGAITTAQRGTVQTGMRLRGRGGLAPSQMAAMFASTEAGMRARLMAIQKDLGLGRLDESTLADVMKKRYGMDVDTETALRLAQQLREGDMDEAVAEMSAIRDQAEEQAAAADPRAALSAVLAMKDPVQELFNIKNLLKVMVLSVDGILGLIAPFVGGAVGRIREYTRGVLGEQTGEETTAVRERKKKLEAQGEAIRGRFQAAHEELGGAETEAQKKRIGDRITSLNQQMIDNATTQSEVGEQLNTLVRDAELISGGGGEEGEETSSLGADALREMLTGGGEEGRLLPSSTDIIGSMVESAMPEGVSAALTGGAGFISSMFGGGEEAPASAAARARGARQIGAGAAGQRARASLGPSPEGAMDATGDGTVTVGADGRAIMTVRMTIDNMQEVVAHANTELEAGITNFFS